MQIIIVVIVGIVGLVLVANVVLSVEKVIFLGIKIAKVKFGVVGQK